MNKSPDAFRTISEVAEWLGVQAHVLRFWESKFAQVKPVKRAGGRRYYRPSDMLLLGGIKKLLHDDGLTIKGVQKILREQGVGHVSALSQELCAAAAEAAAKPVGEVTVKPADKAPEPEKAPEDAKIVPFGAAPETEPAVPEPAPEPAPQQAEEPAATGGQSASEPAETEPAEPAETQSEPQEAPQAGEPATPPAPEPEPEPEPEAATPPVPESAEEPEAETAPELPLVADAQSAPVSEPEPATAEEPEPEAAPEPEPEPEPVAAEQTILPSFLHRPSKMPESAPAPESEPARPVALVVDAPDPPEDSELPYTPGPLARLAAVERLAPAQAAKIAPLARELQSWLARSGGAGAA